MTVNGDIAVRQITRKWSCGVVERRLPNFYCKHLYTIYPKLTKGKSHPKSRYYNTQDINTRYHLLTYERGGV